MRFKRAALIAAGLACAALAQNGSQNGKDVEWPTYGADLRNSRYRPLDQIHAGNFNKLEVAWRFKTDNIGNRPEYKLEGTPLMVNGVLYATAGSRRAAIALDAATGELLWVHGEHEGARGAAAPRQLSGRGLAYWTDGKEYAQQQRLRARIRRAHGQAPMDLPHNSEAGRIRIRHLGERVGGVHGQ